jgi:eukaryotic-like serine/threonine-protein kinase
VVGEFEALLAGAGAVPEGELDFDDFRDELAAGRSVPPLAVVETPRKKPAAKQKPAKSTPGKSRKPLLIGAGAAVALVAVVPVVFRPGGDDPADRVAAPPPAVSTPTPTPPKQATIKLNPPVDKGTSVVLTWSGPPRVTYAVIVAEQGAKQPQTTLRGTMTSLTVQVSSGLKYCFQVQGTDGVERFDSEPRPIRGATCSG